MTTISEQVWAAIDEKIANIEAQKKQASIIVINDKIFRQLQQEMMYKDSQQSYGKVRSPFDLQVYNRVRVVTSQVVETIEVL